MICKAWFGADGLEVWCLCCHTWVTRNRFSPTVRLRACGQEWCAQCIWGMMQVGSHYTWFLLFVKMFLCLFLTCCERTGLCQSVLHISSFIRSLGTEHYCLCSVAVHFCRDLGQKCFMLPSSSCKEQRRNAVYSLDARIIVAWQHTN